MYCSYRIVTAKRRNHMLTSVWWKMETCEMRMTLPLAELRRIKAYVRRPAAYISMTSFVRLCANSELNMGFDGMLVQLVHARERKMCSIVDMAGANMTVQAWIYVFYTLYVQNNAQRSHPQPHETPTSPTSPHTRGERVYTYTANWLTHYIHTQISQQYIALPFCTRSARTNTQTHTHAEAHNW